MKGCSNCRHHVSKLGDNVNAYGNFEIYRKCELGREQTMRVWWNKNGHKPTNEITDDLSCHEFHELIQHLIDMNEKIDELESLIRNRLNPLKSWQ
jgi:hypothetical protein